MKKARHQDTQVFLQSQRYALNPARRLGYAHAVLDFPLVAYPTARKISRVMRFAEVKKEAEGRVTRSKAHRPTDSPATVRSPATR